MTDSFGLVPSFTSNPDGILISVIDDSKTIKSDFSADVTTFPSGLFVSADDFSKGVFYCIRGKEVRLKSEISLKNPFCCLYDDDSAKSAQIYTLKQITVVNETITNVQNNITNVVNTSVSNQFTTILGADYSTQFADLGNQITTQEASIAGLQTLTNYQGNIITQNSDDIHANQTSIVQLNSTTQDLSSTQGSMQTSVSNLSTTTTYLESQIQTIKGAQTTDEVNIATLQQTVLQNQTTATQSANTLQQSLQSTNTNVANNYSSLSSILSNISSKQQTDESNIQNNTSSISTIQNTNIPNIQGQITTNNQTISTIQTQTIPIIQGNVATNISDINTIKTQTIPNLQTSLQGTGYSAFTTSPTLSNLQTGLNTTNTNLTNQIAKELADFNSQATLITNNTSTITTLQTKESADIAAIQGSGFVSGTTLASLLATITTLQNTVTALTTRVTTAETNITTVAARQQLSNNVLKSSGLYSADWVAATGTPAVGLIANVSSINTVVKTNATRYNSNNPLILDPNAKMLTTTY